MGNLLNSNQTKQKFIMAGLDNAGKTTILYKLGSNKVETIIPTIGFNVEQITQKQYEIYSWDVGGSDRRVQVYQTIDKIYNGLIYVVDYSDKERLECTIAELHKLFNVEILKGLPLLLLINKVESTLVNKQQIVSEFKLENFCKNWHVQHCCAITGDGVADGLKWLLKQIQ